MRVAPTDLACHPCIQQFDLNLVTKFRRIIKVESDFGPFTGDVDDFCVDGLASVLVLRGQLAWKSSDP